ncbi:hypothetical protein GE061_006484 [Apolygus lucorum]|uniref:Reverse transcriptase domain-containing protein n=1 Tax=Apolygus lucorum TaxID=248454 RepID=A0A8S9WU18_APOLU|nr:hypothetical protein GE061_006484 [Apolygus lucorum]
MAAPTRDRVECPDCQGSYLPRGLARHRRACPVLGASRNDVTLSADNSQPSLLSPSYAAFRSPVDTGRVSSSDTETDDQTEQEVVEKLGEVFNGPYLNRPGDPSSMWYARWRLITRLKGKQYDLPGGSTSGHFIGILADEVEALVGGIHPSERLFIYVSVLLQRDKMVKQASDIRLLLQRRIQLWVDGEIDALIAEALTSDRKLGGRPRRGVKNKQTDSEAVNEGLVKMFHRLMSRGKVREASRWLMEGGTTTVLAPESEIDENGTTVLDELSAKHPSPTIPNPSQIQLMGGQELPPMLQVQVTNEHVEKVARKLHGGGGPSGTSSEQWVDFLLRHGRHSQRLRAAVATLANKLANENVSWESIQALVASRLVALDKCPGVRPIGVGECLRRILGKCMAEVTGEDVTVACGEKQLCGGLAAGIEGAVHAMSTLYREKATANAHWGLLLVDAKNAFNAMNRMVALWQARIRWPRCARFLYNTYKGHAELVFRGSENKLYSREGVTQGDPLAMLLYGISTLPLIEKLQDPRMTQCWYADDSSAQGHFGDLRSWWDKLLALGPDHGYFPQGPKSFLVVHPDDIEEAKERFSGTGITVVTGQRFLGGYVGDKDGKQAYLKKKMEKWTDNIKKISMASITQPQSAYVAFTNSKGSESTSFHECLLNCGIRFIASIDYKLHPALSELNIPP